MRQYGIDTLCNLTCFLQNLSFVKDGWMLARYNQVYLLISWLIKSESRNILIFLISQLPLIITCKMGDVG